MKRKTILFIIMTAVIMLLFIINICTGSVSVSPSEILRVIMSGDHDSYIGRIILDIRLPRIVQAAFLGGGLALSGYLLQTFFNNPIAGPYILGISSGAKLFVAVLMVFSMGAGFVLRSWMMVAAAFIGSLTATSFVLLVSSKVRAMAILIVCGVMIGYICSAVTDLLVTFADDNNIVNLHNWSLGTFSSASWDDALCYIPVVTAGFIAAFLMSKTIEVYAFGEEYAYTLGVNVKHFRLILILVSSLLSATVTAFAGPVSFVGIAMPHVARTVLRSSDPREVIPASFMLGTAFCLLSDMLARSLFAPTELSISTVTAVFGAPIVIGMLLKRRRADG